MKEHEEDKLEGTTDHHHGICSRDHRKYRSQAVPAGYFAEISGKGERPDRHGGTDPGVHIDHIYHSKDTWQRGGRLNHEMEK